MKKQLLKIIFGILILSVFIFTGIPFEIENPIVEAIFRIISFTLVFILIYILFRQAKQIIKVGIRKTSYIILGIVAFLFVIGAIWNDLLLGNPRGDWYNLEVCVNKSGTIILRQMRETSGSIYDYRDRVVIYEFDAKNRISINTNVKFHEGPWTVIDKKNNIPKRVKYLE